MGGTPKKSLNSGPAKGETPSAPMQMTEMLAREGAPWRPFEDKGVLLKPLKTPRSAAGIFAACEKQLVSHLKAVCLWPQKDRNQSWRVGDYSYYILEFAPKPGTIVYVQFWSQPDDDDGVLFEVSSGAMNPPADKFVDTEKQELLRDHGFEIAGNAGNFRKAIKIENAREVRAAAREAIALLTKVLGYDGTLELRYDLSLQTQMTVRHVFSKVSPDTLEKLLREWGFPAELKPREEGKPPQIDCRAEAGPFGVLLLDEEREGSDSYQALALRTFHSLPPGDDDDDVAVRLGLANQVNRKFTALQASVDNDGDLLLETTVLLHGGVTAEHLRARFEVWRGMVRAVGEGMKPS